MNPYASGEQRGEIDTQPVYNIKAVVEATGLAAATLRAWERRYGALQPRRSESGYRLYSDNDIVLLRWLKARIDEGISIRQAIALLSHRRRTEQPQVWTERRRDTRLGIHDSRDALLGALLDFDESQADRIVQEAVAVHDLESVAEYMIAPSMVRIGDLWHRGEASTAAEHFASTYLRRKVDAIINASPRAETGALVVMGCAPDDWHELGLLLLHLFLRRQRINTLYLGPSVPVEQFRGEMERLHPALIVISATTSEAVPGLIGLADLVQSIPVPRPTFAYGGRIFNIQPELRRLVPGCFLGEQVRDAVRNIERLLNWQDAEAVSGAELKIPPKQG